MAPVCEHRLQHGVTQSQFWSSAKPLCGRALFQEYRNVIKVEIMAMGEERKKID